MACNCAATETTIVRDGVAPVKWCYRCGSLFAYNIHRVEDSHAEKCTHPASSIRRGARWEWCAHCGAVRVHASRKPLTYWLRPTGTYGRNPGEPKPLPPRKKKDA